MARPSKPVTCAADAFEIIELMSDDLNVLARAFEVIDLVCREGDEGTDALSLGAGIPDDHLQ